jgi:hypothetical protein
MMSYSDLVATFGTVIDLGDGIFKGRIVVPKRTLVYYFRLTAKEAGTIAAFTISHNSEDDDFAKTILRNVPQRCGSDRLELHPLPNNPHGFSSILIAPKSFHSELQGTHIWRGEERLTLCLPVHRAEFSGSETIDEFHTLRLNVVPTCDWTRAIHPKILLRFDNQETGGGTVGGTYVLVKYDLLRREIERLSSADGFIEIINYREAVVEILSPEPNVFHLISNRDDALCETLSEEELMKKVWDFLTV